MADGPLWGALRKASDPSEKAREWLGAGSLAGIALRDAAGAQTWPRPAARGQTDGRGGGGREDAVRGPCSSHSLAPSEPHRSVRGGRSGAFPECPSPTLTVFRRAHAPALPHVRPPPAEYSGQGLLPRWARAGPSRRARFLGRAAAAHCTLAASRPSSCRGPGAGAGAHHHASLAFRAFLPARRGEGGGTNSVLRGGGGAAGGEEAKRGLRVSRRRRRPREQFWRCHPQGTGSAPPRACGAGKRGGRAPRGGEGHAAARSGRRALEGGSATSKLTFKARALPWACARTDAAPASTRGDSRAVTGMAVRAREPRLVAKSVRVPAGRDGRWASAICSGRGGRSGIPSRASSYWGRMSGEGDGRPGRVRGGSVGSEKDAFFDEQARVRPGVFGVGLCTDIADKGEDRIMNDHARGRECCAALDRPPRLGSSTPPPPPAGPTDVAGAEPGRPADRPCPDREGAIKSIAIP